MSTASVAAEPAGDIAAEATAEIANNLLRTVHAMSRFRATMSAARGDDAEWVQNRLLFEIALSGPIRASALAESVETDPSTVSRQVAALVRAGLIERRADPGDGRASLLALTETGRARQQRQLQRRDDHYARMLQNWSPADRQNFAALLERFLVDFDAYKPQILAEACAQRVETGREENQ